MRNLLYVLSLLMISNPCLASFRQTIQVCVNVTGNNSPLFDFAVRFTSTDWLDTYHSSQIIQNGTACASHTYHFGPKNIYIKLMTVLAEISVLNIDESCSYFTQEMHTMTDKIITTTPYENWLIDISKRNYEYDMSCQHLSA